MLTDCMSTHNIDAQFHSEAQASENPLAYSRQVRLHAGLVEHIERKDFPCVGAKSALASGGLAIVTAQAIDRADDDQRIYEALERWSAAESTGGQRFRSLAVVFAKPRTVGEQAFETALWQRLGALLAEDRRRGHSHDPMFSTDPADPHFALSFGGRAYFAVGLHPHASRKARRLPFPAIIFNLHDQFARLREEQKYERMREVILTRDAEFDGEANPMVARHGEISEARQYSGRAVGTDWRCPLAGPGPQ